jgi:hypothetical protein
MMIPCRTRRMKISAAATIPLLVARVMYQGRLILKSESQNRHGFGFPLNHQQVEI